MAAMSCFPATLLRGFPRSRSVRRASFPAISARPPPSFRHASPRIGVSIDLYVNHRFPTVFASGVNPPNPDTGKDKTDSSSSNIADGPPVPTILAAVVVLLLVTWIVGSIVLWLVGLIANTPSS